ncbi:hypothetical protein BB558_005211 [Smittium angustum]|uniref:GPI-anchor transamidase n=1 Tax=Smittium angustum TaxID=133377 RepID=A0A2U1J143_SMIAN|nr:hypothetical protein BB558_005211 [Smittium angustum]
MNSKYLLLVVVVILSIFVVHGDANPEGFFTNSGHTNNWAVLVCTSRFWFNYRHIANTLSMYRTVKRLGIPDSNIILMLADDMACNPRNKKPAAVYDHPNQSVDLYGENVEVDYRGYEVTVENFIRLLTGRVSPDTPRSKRLLSDEKSNIFIYMTGHGGDEFLKFQDFDEISSYDIADAFAQMWEKKRYHQIFFMIDTCQANTMQNAFYSPNIISVGSSKKGQNSYSYLHDNALGVSVIDRFTYYNLKYLENVKPGSTQTLKDLFNSYNPALISSDPEVRSDLFPKNPDKVLISEFFGMEQNIELTTDPISLGPNNSTSLPDFHEHISLKEKLNSIESKVEHQDSKDVIHDFKANAFVSYLAGLILVAVIGVSAVFT